ncbi:MAG: DUF7793 family protein [Ginsengibacter sp.]|jgi:hypothetical protein
MEPETPIIRLLIRNQILIGTYRKQLQIDLQTAKQIVEERIRFTKGKKMAAMILVDGVGTIDKAARDYLASEKGTEGLVATAIIVSRPFDYLMGKFFIKVNKTGIPSRVFYNTRQAENWLQQFIIKK